MSDAVAHDAMPVEGIEDAKPVRAAGDGVSGSVIAGFGLVVLIAAWEGAVRGLHLPSYILPTPEAVVRALWSGIAVSPAESRSVIICRCGAPFITRHSAFSWAAGSACSWGR